MVSSSERVSLVSVVSVLCMVVVLVGCCGDGYDSLWVVYNVMMCWLLFVVF